MIKMIKNFDVGIIKALHEKIFEKTFPEQEFLKKKRNRILELYELKNENELIGYSIFSINEENKNINLWLGGILPNFRKQGYMLETLEESIKKAKDKGYKSVTMSSFNHRPEMLRLAIKVGFKIIGTEKGNYGDEIKIRFKYNLNKREIRISLTNICNFKCLFCHNEGFDFEEKPPMELKTLIYILNQAKKNKYSKITFTGGEPLLRFDELKGAIEYLNETNYTPRIKIVTNGAFISGNLIELIKSYKGKIILNISLHSFNSLIFKKITNSNYNLDKIFTSLKMLNKFNIQYKINYVVLNNINFSSKGIEFLLNKSIELNIPEISFLELLISKENKNLIKYYYSFKDIVEKLEETAKNLGEIEITESNERKNSFNLNIKNKSLKINSFRLTCNIGCKTCKYNHDNFITADAKYQPCFLKPDLKYKVTENNMEELFLKGNKIIENNSIENYYMKNILSQ